MFKVILRSILHLFHKITGDSNVVVLGVKRTQNLDTGTLVTYIDYTFDLVVIRDLWIFQ